MKTTYLLLILTVTFSQACRPASRTASKELSEVFAKKMLAKDFATQSRNLGKEAVEARGKGELSKAKNLSNERDKAVNNLEQTLREIREVHARISEREEKAKAAQYAGEVERESRAARLERDTSKEGARLEKDKSWAQGCKEVVVAELPKATVCLYLKTFTEHKRLPTDSELESDLMKIGFTCLFQHHTAEDIRQLEFVKSLIKDIEEGRANPQKFFLAAVDIGCG